MSDREMSAQQLLEHLYRGLNVGRDAQVETVRQDMPGLAPAREFEQAEDCAVFTAGKPAESTVAVGMERAQPLHECSVRASAPPRRVNARVIPALGVVAVIGIMTGVFYKYAAPDRSARTSLTGAIQEPSLFDTAMRTSRKEVEPVVFVNPFDETEVFEFPPGTSEEEAREAVADKLIKRAMERRAQWREG